MSAEEEAQRLAAETLLTMAPARIVKGMERRKGRVIVGRDARILACVERLAPVSYWKILERIRPRA